MEKGVPVQEVEGGDEGNKTMTYRMALPMRAGMGNFPVEVCSGRVMMCIAMIVHFWHRSFWDTVVIMD